MWDADVPGYAMPMHGQELSRQMKTLPDRYDSLYNAEYRFLDFDRLARSIEDGAVFGEVGPSQGTKHGYYRRM